MNNSEIDQNQDQQPESTLRVRHFPEDGEPEESISYPMESVLSRTQQLEELLLSLNVQKYPTTSFSRQNEQRQFSRCPMIADGTSAILTLNGRSYDCQLVEMSIGGFGVVIPGLPKLTRGSEGRLRAPGLNYVVSMSRQEIRPGGTYVGLRQIEEILDNPPYIPHPPIVNYLIAAVAGGLIATLMYYFRVGT
jgi:hypothetical protein